MSMMNRVLRAYIGKFVVIYFDNILIYNKSLNDHIEYLSFVLEALRGAKLYVNLKKCGLCIIRVFFLGFVVSANGVPVDKMKIKAFKD